MRIRHGAPLALICLPLLSACPRNPDLQIVDFWWNPGEPEIGVPVTFSARVVNLGGPTQADVQMNYWFDDQGIGVSASKSGMAAGEVAVLTTDVTHRWAAAQGTFSVRAEVDYQNLISELKETNNELTRTVRVGVPLPAQTTLWNPEQRYQAFLTMDSNFDPSYGMSFGTKLWEGDLDGNPPNPGNQLWCFDISAVCATPDGSNPTFFHQSLNWDPIADHAVYPGYAIWQLAGGAGVPGEFQYLNYAHTAPDPCTIREVGLILDTHDRPTTESVSYSFIPERRSLGLYDEVRVEFEAKETYYSGPPQCGSYPTAMVKADILVEYRDASGQMVRWDILSATLSDHSASWIGDPLVFWTDGCQNPGYCRKLLRGPAIGIEPLDGDYKHYSIDFKWLLARYGEPPPRGMNLDDAKLSGVHIYTSVRGADISAAIGAVDVLGVNE